MNQKQKFPIILILVCSFLWAAPAALQAQYDYTTNADGTSITITGYSGPGGVVIIPTNINGFTVTNIGDGAFGEVTNLTSVTIPGSVTNLGVGSFILCVGLTNVTIPGSVATIGESAFHDCTNLPSITMLDGLLSIGVSAFLFCDSLTNVTIPASVTNIPSGEFTSCRKLTSVTIPGSFGSGEDLLNVFGSTSANVALANGVTFISSGLLYGGDMTNFTILDTVTSIGGYAFDSCNYLTNLTIPASVTNIGTNAFIYCNGLTSLFFAGNAPSFDSPLFNQANKTVYYLPGATGWSNTFAGAPAVLWNPSMQSSGPGLGVQGNQFAFNITGTSNIPIVVEACTNLASPVWTPLQSLTLTNGSFFFSEPLQTNGSGRFYRISSP